MVPVDSVQVGCNVVAVGGVGVTGCALIRTCALTAEVHPAALVSVKV
ncbi:hypothetical protein [Flavobacterium columnare]|nr:hypothetical protein [Flavobacterium columnare]